MRRIGIVLVAAALLGAPGTAGAAAPDGVALRVVRPGFDDYVASGELAAGDFRFTQAGGALVSVAGFGAYASPEGGTGLVALVARTTAAPIHLIRVVDPAAGIDLTGIGTTQVSDGVATLAGLSIPAAGSPAWFVVFWSVRDGG